MIFFKYSVSSSENWYGMDHLKIIATDGEFSVENPLTVDITPVNDAPYLKFEGQVIHVVSGITTTLNLENYFSDVDSENLTIEVIGADNIIIERLDTEKIFNITIGNVGRD